MLQLDIILSDPMERYLNKGEGNTYTIPSLSLSVQSQLVRKSYLLRFRPAQIMVGLVIARCGL